MSAFKIDKLVNKFANGKVLSVAQIKKLGIKNPSAHVAYMRNYLGIDIVTSKKNEKTFYGFHSVAA